MLWCGMCAGQFAYRSFYARVYIIYLKRDVDTVDLNMSTAEPLIIPTEREGVTLRQLWTDADDAAYNEAYNASRADIAVFDPDSDDKHRTIEQTRDARLNTGNKLRMGIWDGDTFVGSVNATPDDHGVEIGYWTDSRRTGHGYATLAARALGRHMLPRYANVHAEVVEGNDASARVLEKAGFGRAIGRVVGRLSFEVTQQPRILFPSLYGRHQLVDAGEYEVLHGTDALVQVSRDRLWIVTEGPSFNRDPFPGIHDRGLHAEPGRGQRIISFLYHKLDPETGQLERDERVIIWEGIGYGEHSGHQGQPPTWYLVGSQIGTIDHETGEFVPVASLTEQAGADIPAKHFSMACIDGPLGFAILANPK